MADKFVAAVESRNEATLKEGLTELFTSLMNADKGSVSKELEFLLGRKSSSFIPSPVAEQKDDNQNRLDLNELIPRLHSQYPGDVGVFAPLMLNAFSLVPGEAIFLGPNEPHAYLDGDCVEVMACSDNVVRAGLTPKLRDTPTLCSMLTYKAMLPQVYTGDAIDNHTKAYAPPVEEFILYRTELSASDGEYPLPRVKSPSIVLVYSGEGSVSSTSSPSSQPLVSGSTLLVHADKSINLKASEGSNLVLFRCAESEPVHSNL